MGEYNDLIDGQDKSRYCENIPSTQVCTQVIAFDIFSNLFQLTGSEYIESVNVGGTANVIEGKGLF